MATEETKPFLTWCVLEIMGHKKLAGMMTEATVAGHGFLRIDVYTEEGGDPVLTQLFNPTSVYAMTPTTQAVCLAYSRNRMDVPLAQWEVQPRQLAADVSYPASTFEPVDLDIGEDEGETDADEFPEL